MSRVTKEGLYIALLVGMGLSIPARVAAQESAKEAAPAEPPSKEAPAEKPPAKEAPAEAPPTKEAPAEVPPPAKETPADGAPAKGAPPDKPPETEAPSRQAPEKTDDEGITRDVNSQEWITPDVAAQEEEQEENQAEDVDEVIIEYAPSPDMEQDTVKDIEGKKLEETPALPTVSKSVEVQDPSKLEPGADKETGVQGQVVSKKPKKVLPDAPVLAKGDEDGKLRSTITDERGRYRLYLPPGKYTLRSYYDLYHGARWDDIEVKRGKFKRVNFILDPISEEDAGVVEQEIIYRADTASEEAQLNIRKETVGVQDSISAQEISRAGDSNAKGAVSRVVGVTIDDNGRIIIRGLADRYNTILLNGVPIPGVDPDVPSVKLDIFPTDVVSNLAVIKVPRPDLYANWAGGLLNIETSNYPRKQMLKVGISFGANSLSTFRQMPNYKGSAHDWIGYDNGTRALPPTVGGNRLLVSDRFNPGRYVTNDQLDQVVRSFPDNWNPRYKTAIPMMGLKLSAGNFVNLKHGRKAGYLVSFLYDYQEKIRTGFNARYKFDSEGNPNVDRPLQTFDYQGGIQEVLWGTFVSGILELNPENFINFTSLFSRTSKDTALMQYGSREDEEYRPLTKNSYDFIGRTLFFNQLTGDHQNLGHSKVRLQWNAVVSNGKRDEPDRREIQQFVQDQRVSSATRFYSTLNQLAAGGKSDIRFPLYRAFESTAYAKMGVNAGYQERSFTARRFAMQNTSNQNLIGDPETIFGQDGIGTVSTMREVTRPDDSYNASNSLYGGYLQLETPVTEWLQFLGMLRTEIFTQKVYSFSAFSDSTEPIPGKGTDRTDIDPLPSATFKFRINEQMSMTLGYGKTVIRPMIRELAPFTYVDFLRGWSVTGNKDLQRTRVQNVEARYEYFFGKTDLIAATPFFKYLNQPIEFVVLSQINGTAGYRNAEHAWLAGGEVEFRLGFGRFTEKLEKFFFVGNVAVMASQTTLPSGQMISGRLQRRLFNQSPFVTNLSLRFDDPDTGVMAGLVYNAFGPRIVEAGSSSGGFVIPDVYQQTQHLLDFILTWKPRPHWKLGFKWKNMTFNKVRYKQGGQYVFYENVGTSVSIGAEYIY